MPPRSRRPAAQRASMAITDMADRDLAMSSRSRRAGEGRNAGRAPSLDSNLSAAHSTSQKKQLRQSSTAKSVGGGPAIGSTTVHSRRPTRGPKKRYVESDTSDDVDDMEEEEDDDDIDIDEDDNDDDDEEEEQQDEIKVADVSVNTDAAGEADDMDIDAEGDPDDIEEDAEGDIDMDVTVPPHSFSSPAITVTKPTASEVPLMPSRAARKLGSKGRTKATSTAKAAGRKGKSASRNKSGSRMHVDDEGEEDDGEGEEGDEEDDEPTDDDSVARAAINASVEVTGEDDEAERAELSEMGMDGNDEEDAEGDEIEVAEDGEEEEEEGEEEDDEEEEDVEVEEEDEEDDEGGDDDGESEGGTNSRAETPDLSKMTRRQRARFEETPQEYMKLSDEVQVKKHFTAEELSMRRAEMARRRRNLSEKRNEEVKAETINKLLKRQAPKTTKKNALAGDDSGDEDGQRRPDPVVVRWVSNKQGSRVAVPIEILDSPVGAVFGPRRTGQPAPRKMVEEVS